MYYQSHRTNFFSPSIRKADILDAEENHLTTVFKHITLLLLALYNKCQRFDSKSGKYRQALLSVYHSVHHHLHPHLRPHPHPRHR